VVLGPLADRFGWRLAAAVAALPALLAAAAVWRWVEEPAVPAARGLVSGLSRPLLLLTWVNGVQLAVAAGFVTFLPAYYAGRGASLTVAGLLTALAVAAGVVAQPLGGGLSDRWGRPEVFVAALLALGLSLLGFPHADGLWLVTLAVLIGFWASLTPSIALVYAAELASGGRTGQAVGVVWGVGIALSSLAPPATGALIDAFGFGLAYAVLGLVALATALVALRLPRAAATPHPFP
jgi:FSR family fosmidomycin resistance protein-like MFS transporter